MGGAASHRFRPAERGFTLLELLIAAAVFAIVVVIIVSSFTTTLTSIEQTREQAEVFQTARLAVDRMFSDLTSTFFIGGDERYQFVGRDERAEGEQGAFLSFVTVAPRSVLGGVLPGGLARVEYFLGPDLENEDETVLYRREVSLLAGEKADTGEVAILGEDVRSFGLEYYDAAGTPQDAWNSADAEGERSLPVAVQITLVLGRSDPGQIFTTVVPIP